MIFLVHRPISGDIVGMTAEELMDFVTVPDHQDLVIKVEMAFEAEAHECEPVQEGAEVTRDS